MLIWKIYFVFGIFLFLWGLLYRGHYTRYSYTDDNGKVHSSIVEGFGVILCRIIAVLMIIIEIAWSVHLGEMRLFTTVNIWILAHL